MKKIAAFFVLIALTLTVSAKSPKYIFYFIGDGMGFAQIYMTQASIAAKDGKIGYAPLSFSDFPAKGWATTHAANRLTTCSAAAGTALATGHKTSIGTIGMNTDHSANLTSIAVKAKEMGRKVGIMTSVSIDHATPASFFAHAKSRSEYKKIADWIPTAGFDFYAGSGLLNVSENYYDSISKNCGYTVVRGKDAQIEGNKIVWVERKDKSAESLAMKINRKDDDMTLPGILDEAIDFMEDAPKGFFMMIEGGQIDWAAHTNDAASIMGEVVDLSQAVAKALEFYHKHPKETLIVITADHETGGLALGRNDRGYDTNLEKLFDQKASKTIIGDETVTKINQNAGVDFTSGSHTAIPVPVFAIGVGSQYFVGEMDNTDIPNRILKLMQNQKAK